MIPNSKGILKWWYFILLMIGVNGVALSQHHQKSFKKGLHHFDKGNFVGATDQLQPLLDSGWNVNEVSSYLAQCYFELHEPEKAKLILEQIDEPSVENEYLLILAYYFTENFDVTDSLIQSFKDTVDFDVNYFKEKLGNTYSKYGSSKGFVVQNFGPEINSKNREYSAVMYNDFNKLLFTSRKAKGEQRDKDGLDFETIYATTIDSTNNWIKASPLKISLESEKRHDATVQVFKKGSKMISYHDGQLWESSLNGDEWTKEGSLDIHDLEGRDTHCFITDDESTIYFASDHLSYGAHLDLFMSTRNRKGQWSEPKPIEKLNTEYDEDAPYLAGDGTFYFSSRGHGSMGGYDIFKTKYDTASGEWSTPENLGHPINTVAEDTYYTMDGKLAYLSSTRMGGYGSLDLYRVFLFNKVKIHGTLVDEHTQEPIPDVTIDVQYDSIFLRSFTDYNGNYEMFVPINKNMKITFVKDSLNLYEGEYVVNVFFKDANNNEFNFQIDYSGDGDVSSVKSNKGAGKIPIIIRNDFSRNAIVDSVSSPREKEWASQQNMESEALKMEWEKQRASTQEIQNVVHFESNSYNLDSKAIAILEQLVLELKKHKGVVEIVGHTDIRGQSTLNAKLSVKRALRVRDYLTKKGLNTENYLVRGAGSSDLMDDGTNSIAHKKNRRVEINY